MAAKFVFSNSQKHLFGASGHFRGEKTHQGGQNRVNASALRENKEEARS